MIASGSGPECRIRAARGVHRMEDIVQDRVITSCDLDTPAGLERRELPFVVLIAAEVVGGLPAPDRRAPKDRPVLRIDRDRFDDALMAMRPRLTIDGIPGLGTVQLRFNRMADFEPPAIVEQVDALWKRLQQRREYERRWRRTPEPLGVDDRHLAMLDEQQSKPLSAILHHHAFQRLEATWRGIHHLVCGSMPSETVVFRLLDLDRAELLPALAPGDDKGPPGALAQAVVDAASGSEPFGLVVAAWEFGPDTHSVACLQRMAAIAARAHVPVIAAADAAAFRLGRQVTSEADDAAFAEWAEFRQSDDASFVGLTVPRVLLRRPYGDGGNAVDGFDFQERVWPAQAAGAVTRGLPQPLHGRLLWGNAAFALAAALAGAFARHGSAAAAWNADDRLAVDPLPRFGYLAADAIEALVGPAEVHWTERDLRRLGEGGFLPLARDRATGRTAFQGMHTCCQPRRHTSVDADATAQAHARLGGLLVATRIAQALRLMLAQAPRRWATRAEAEAELRAWLARHVTTGDDSVPGRTPVRPLRSARLQVMDVPGAPGRLRVAVTLRPRLQPGVAEAPLRLVVEAGDSG